jgi:uncharacterized membrane protein YfcA
MSLSVVKILFAVFCFFLSIFVFAASIYGGLANILGSARDSASSPSSVFRWTLLSTLSFLAGLLLVPTIGVGPALTTFIALELSGVSSQRAMVTGVVTGGWACLPTLLVHLLYYHDIPLQLWVMVLPGVYIGAKYAPRVHELVGITKILMAFAIFLLCNAVLFLLT